MDKKSIFLALFILLIVVLAFYFSIAENIIIPEKPQEEAENQPEAELEEVDFNIYNKDGKYRINIESQKVDNYKSEAKMHLRPIYGEVYSTKSGELLYTLEGDFARYYLSVDQLEIRGNVVLNSDRYKLEADEVDYDLSNNQLQGRGSIVINGSDFVSRAASFNSNLNLKDLELSKKENNSQPAEIRFNQLKEELNNE